MCLNWSTPCRQPTSQPRKVALTLSLWPRSHTTLGTLWIETPEDTADLGIDAKHEEIGYRWLAARFSKDVCEPAYLHVSAKRYLCATDASYLGTLSAASLQSLELQGGPMTPSEIQAFELNEYYREAVALRHWDDKAKIVGLATPPLSTYLQLVNTEALRR